MYAVDAWCVMYRDVSGIKGMVNSSMRVITCCTCPLCPLATCGKPVSMLVNMRRVWVVNYGTHGCVLIPVVFTHA
jgi:hypothetical protein